MKNSTKHIDEKWFFEYVKIGAFSEINFLRPDKSNYQEEKNKFLEGEIDQPKFSYNLDQPEIFHKKNLLNNLKGRIEFEEKNVIVQDVYIQTIDEKIKILELLEATVKKDDALFTSLSENIYGKPHDDFYKKALGILKGVINKNNLQCSDSFLKILSDSGATIPFGFQITPKSETITADNLKQLFIEKIKELGFGFRVEITNSVASVTIKYFPKKKILIPKDKTWNKNIAEGLVAHEIDVHLQRSQNGEQSPLALLSTGLFGYLEAEEGLAMYLELEKNKSKLPGIYNYLIPSLMCGLYGAGPLGFRQVFNFTYEYNLIINKLTGGELTENQLKSKTWENIWRSARGTTGQTTGTCLTRDIIYFQGFNKIKNLIESDDFEYQRLFLGKYDPNNKDHLDILDKLGIHDDFSTLLLP